MRWEVWHPWKHKKTFHEDTKYIMNVLLRKNWRRDTEILIFCHLILYRILHLIYSFSYISSRYNFNNNWKMPHIFKRIVIMKIEMIYFKIKIHNIYIENEISYYVIAHHSYNYIQFSWYYLFIFPYFRCYGQIHTFAYATCFWKNILQRSK